MQRPVLGILTAGQGKVPGNREMFRFVQEACQTAGLVSYVFTPEYVNWERGTVWGYRYQQGQWRARQFPLPNVVYNRVPNRKLEGNEQVRLIKRRLRARGIPYYNASYLNKYDLYRVLQSAPVVRDYLPWTRLVRGRADIQDGLRRFGSIYLKPRHAFAGKGIFRVSLQGNGWSFRYRQRGTNREIKGTSRPELWQLLDRHMEGRSYIVQQAISLARYKGRAFDIRLLAQKNGTGQWQVSGMGIRVAGKGSITTHVPNGGYIATPEEVLPVVFGEDAEKVREKTSRLAMLIAPQVELGYKGLFGEMSMDIGLDTQGHPWFFEANAKPMRFDERRIRGVGLKTLVAYTRYLAGKVDGGR